VKGKKATASFTIAQPTPFTQVKLFSQESIGVERILIEYMVTPKSLILEYYIPDSQRSR
jgi:hypothetical protein